MALRIGCTQAAARAGEAVPDRQRAAPGDVAYVDSSHVGRFSSESWRDDGLMGLCLTLMRDGYLTLNMEQFSAARLSRAGLLVCVAPSRPYAQAERKAIREFVERGGSLIVTVGYPDRRPVRPLLRELGLDIGDAADRPADWLRGPRAMGFFKSPYYNGGSYLAHVRFHAAWPVVALADDAQVLAYGRGDLPVILMRRVGRGRVVVVGDTCFAMNKNLEVESGQPFEGLRENPHFWRWLLSQLRGGPPWLPPDPTVAGGEAQ
jgi:hypothetical protein